MQSYDDLRGTWIYQEIQQEIRAEELQQRLEEHRHMLLEIVRARFPRIELLATGVIEKIKDPAHLQQLIVRVSVARIEKEARACLSEI